MEFQTFDHLTVADVPKDIARDLILERHYSHKWQTTFGAENIGVYRDGQLLGVAVYGYPMNPKSWHTITTLEPNECLELNRLWIDDVLGKNTETWLMSQSFDILRSRGYRLVQSFADGRLGVGTIYQAANFTYHGNHKTLFHRDAITGTIYHDTPFTNTAVASGMVFRNLLHAQGRTQSFTAKTYRYLKPLDRGARRTVKIQKLAYPKERDGVTELSDYSPPPAQIARAYALADAMKNHSAAATLSKYLHSLTGNPDELIAAQRLNPWVAKLKQRHSDTAPTLFDIESTS